MKKPNEKERPIMINENRKKNGTEFEKIISPSSNNYKGKPNQTTNNMRMEDERINLKQNINPFNKQPTKGESREKELSRQLRINSNSKKMKIEPNRMKK